MEKALRIPELVRLICEHAEPADNVHLALTCRKLFTLAIPMAWAHVPCVSQLLLLIEGTSYEKVSEDHPFGGIVVQLPDNLERISQSRFTFYAPFVTSLEIYRNKHQLLWVAQLKSLARFAFGSTNALLPKLRLLTIASVHSTSKSYALWVDIFSCPSLLEVRFPGANALSPISHIAAAHITSALHRNCPKIRRLELFWDTISSDASIHEDDDIPPTYGDPIHGSQAFVHELLPHYTSLTSIIGGVSMLEDPTLLALGSLPELRHLEVRYPADEWGIFGPNHLEFPPQSFPKLDRLVLCDLVQYDATSVWNIPILVAHLRSVTLKFTLLLDENGQVNASFQSFIHLLCTQSPHINELILEFNCQEAGSGSVGPYIYDFTQDTFSAMGNLKLTRLEVFRARLTGETPLKSLVDTWPNIKVLCWPDQPIQPSDLPLFAAKLPELRHLGLEIDFSLPLDEGSIGLPTTISQRQLQILESRFHLLGRLSGNQGAKLYRFLREIIPNAKLEIRPDSLLDSFEDRNFDLICANAINSMERLLSPFDQHGWPKANDSKMICAQVGFAWDMALLHISAPGIEPDQLCQMIISRISR